MSDFDVVLHRGLIVLNSVAGDHVGFTRTVPLSRRRSREGRMWWEASTADAQAVVTWAEAKELRVSPEVAAYAGSLWRKETQHLSTASAITLGKRTMPSIVGLEATLLDTQRVLVSASTEAWFAPPGQDKLRHRAILLADDQGLGKTLSALSILRVEGHESVRAVVVCPTSLTENWRGEMSLHFTEGTFTAWVASGMTPGEIPESTDILIIGWDILAAWSETIIAWKPDAIVADEGHYAKSGKQQKRTIKAPRKNEQGQIIYGRNGQAEMESVTKIVGGSARATAILEIGKAVSGNHGLIMPMTGTPIVNRPLELLPLIEFAGIERLFVSGTEYKERYCGPTWVTVKGGRKAKEYKGATNLLELNTRLLVSGVYYRRTKKVLVDQGLLKRKFVDGAYVYDYGATPRPWTVKPTEDEWAQYEAIRDQTKDFFTTRAEEIAAEKRTGVNTQLIQQKVAAEGAKHLKVITELRQATAKLKVPHIIEQVAKLVEKGEKVVIAAHHREVVAAYAEAFGGLRIQGDMGSKAIEKAKALFNGTPVTEYPVIVLSVDAGKTGHTLCKQSLEGVGPACAYMIFAEQIWTPGDEAQTQDRIWRIGQDREVRISNALFANSIDQSIYGQRVQKRKVFNAAIDAIDPEVMAAAGDALDSGKSERSGAGRLAQQLVYGDPSRMA